MAEKNTVIIGCRLPHGLYINIGDTRTGTAKQILLAGANRSEIRGVDVGLTEVDKSEADIWFKEHSEADYVKSGGVFIMSDEKSAASKAKELKDEETGFESLEPTAMGVKPADKE
jgi:ethanolamine utilization microcompartment shell protein EutL